ncbi:protein AMBP-like [Archocentrus centrarchus]|uniref:protein AMBP-like n=1 Tax=Archocentrus centrarchus TaxID=63155 RepID=UPI0011EA259A|nr:protein AMBP-like [Archocentrus centrarchus]
MQGAVNLGSVLFMGWTVLILQVSHVQPQNLTQENFDLEQFMGKWYEVAVVSTCPHYMQRKRGNPVTVVLELKHVASEGNFTMTASALRNGLCTDTSTDYSLTNTPGRFFYHAARLGADVDAFVLHTNYDEYAVIFLLSTEKPSGNKTTIVKLYSRTVEASLAVMDHFKTLVRQRGMSEDAVIVNQYKGECVPGEQKTEPPTQVFVPKRSKRNAAPCKIHP